MACHISLSSSASCFLVFICWLLAGVLQAPCSAHIVPLHAHTASPLGKGPLEQGGGARAIGSADDNSVEHARRSTVEAAAQADPPTHRSSSLASPLPEHRDVEGKLKPLDPKGMINIEVGTMIETTSIDSSGSLQASGLQAHRDEGEGKAHAMDPEARVSEYKGQASSGSNDAMDAPTLASIDYRSPRRSLLPSGTVVKDETEELRLHIVRIRSQSNGVGTGVLLKKNYVLTAKRVVKGFLDPFEFSLELGNETSHGLELFLHVSDDLAVIKVHPPFERTGRIAAPASPKGFFWPLSKHDPSPPSALKLFGYGASFLFTSKDYLTYKSFPVAHKSSQNHLLISSKSTIPTTSGDAGGPAFVVTKRGSTLAGIITSSKPRQGELVSVAQHREWVFDSMKSTCSREEQTFKRLLVGMDGDILIYYHCRVERAERFGIYLTAKHLPCVPGWKAVLIRSNNGKVVAKVETHDKKDKDSLILTPKNLKNASHFFIELWKPKLLGLHTMVSKYGPFNVSDYIDGGLHFEWCQS